MHIAVCIKQVPDSAQIRVHPVTNTIMRQGVPAIVNPFGLLALEEALRLKDRIVVERRGLQFYRDVAAKTWSIKEKSMAEQFAREEAGHVQVIERLLEEYKRSCSAQS